jgi:hypothetical protein
MDLYEQVIQIANLLLPAWVLGLGIVVFSALMARWGWPRAHWALVWQWFLQSALGTFIIIISLIWLGVDGKMTMYALLAMGQASVQWLICRAWRH